MGWERHIPSANESTVPILFNASNESVKQHNKEVYGLKAEIKMLKGELKGMEIAFDIKQAEIEELRECIADTKQYQAGYRSGVKSQQAEIKKLREALEDYEDAYTQSLKDGN